MIGCGWTTPYPDEPGVPRAVGGERGERAWLAGRRLDGLFHDALDARRLAVLFQPLVDLSTQRVIGHEALSRGPAGTSLEQPAGLFATARRLGRTAELDWACRCVAFRDALRAGRCPSWRLFVNAEPEALGSSCPDDLVPDWLRAHRSLRVVVELTERSLLRRPAQLLRVVTTLRELGWEIALDDVGANDDGLALLPVVEPDVVKLDATLLADRLDAGQRATLRAVEAWACRSSAAVVAEGIETEGQLRRAVALGAGWGQGYLFGRPGPLCPREPEPATAAGRRLPARSPGPPEEPRGATPFGLLRDRSERTPREALRERLRELRALARGGPTSSLLLLAVGNRAVLPEQLADWLTELEQRCALVALYGSALPESSEGPLRTTRLAPDDPLGDELVGVLLGPTSSLLVAARPRPDGALDLARTEDPRLVARAARMLLGRTSPLPVAGRGQPAEA